MGLVPALVGLRALADPFVEALVFFGNAGVEDLAVFDFLEETVVREAVIQFVLGLLALGFGDFVAEVDELTQETGVLLLVGGDQELVQGEVGEVVHGGVELGGVGLELAVFAEEGVELVQGISDVPPGIEAGEGGGGGLEAEVLLDMLEGVGLGTGFEPGDDLFLLVGGQGFEGGVGMGFGHNLKFQISDFRAGGGCETGWESWGGFGIGET